MVQRERKVKTSVAAGTKKKSAGKRRTTTRRKKSKKKGGGLTAWLRSLMPGWAWWVGVALVVGFSYLVVHNFLYQPDTETIEYPEGYSVYGIDISRYQGDVNWELLCNQGIIRDHPVRFVFIKATQGNEWIDPQFSYNFTQARKYGFRRSAYHFFSTSVSAKVQADFFIKNVKLEEGDLPPVLDVELPPQGMSDREFKFSVLEWLSLVERHYGVKPILYTYYSFKLRYLNDFIFEQYPYWIAHYDVDEVAYKGPWCFWQFSDKGQLPGIKGHVDLDVFSGTLDDLRELSLQPPAYHDQQ